jgi:4,5-dihydroxyphthalate decarboxylase
MSEEIVAVHGEDPYPYGIDANLPTIEAFCRYAHEQGITQRRLTPEDLFPPEVRATARV